MKTKDILLINPKKEKLSLALILWLFGFLLHNILTGICDSVAVFFFILTVFIIPIYFIIAIVYSIIKWMKQK